MQSSGLTMLSISLIRPRLDISNLLSTKKKQTKEERELRPREPKASAKVVLNFF